MRRVATTVLLAGAMAEAAATSLAAERPAALNSRPLVQTAAGITLGLKTLDAQVVRLFGHGCFLREEGHGGGRYFISPDRSLTLHTIIGVDDATDYVELSSFPNLPTPCTTFQGATSKRLAGDVEIQHGVRLGMTPDALVAVLGPADSEALHGSALTLIYRTDVTKDQRVGLAYEARYRFVANRLTQLSIYDGE